MTSVLCARFRHRYRDGFSVECEVTHPLDRYSVTALFGPSGGGKTTILRCLAGLEQPEAGRITRGDEIWFDAESRTCRSPQLRAIGYLFQEYALFPHLTVAQNILYGLATASRSRRRERLGALLERFGLQGLEARYPSQISGGQQQRVALARAIAREPCLLLLDEPLSALDAVLRGHVRRELRDLLLTTGTPTILVTHDRDEVLAFANQMVVVAAGRILQSGTPGDVFARPASAAAARILGVDTIEPVRVTRTYSHDPRVVRVRLGRAEFDATLAAATSVDVGSTLIACVRAEAVEVTSGQVSQSAGDSMSAIVRDIIPEVAGARVVLDLGSSLSAVITPALAASVGVGDSVVVRIPRESLRLYAPVAGPGE